MIPLASHLAKSYNTVSTTIATGGDTVPVTETQVRAWIREELTNHDCRKFTEAELRELGHAMGMVTDLGDGNTNKGIEHARENHKWLQQLRAKSDRASSIVFGLIVAAVCTGALSALWLGLQAMMAR